MLNVMLGRLEVYMRERQRRGEGERGKREEGEGERDGVYVIVYCCYGQVVFVVGPWSCSPSS